MSEYSPTFVNRDPKAPTDTGGPEKIRHTNPRANDLHIYFAKGGVEVKDKGSAAKAEYGDARRNSVILTFPPHGPLESGPYLPPVTPLADGTFPPEPKPEPGTFVTPTFTHLDPTFPAITKWHWTYNVVKGVGKHRKIVNEQFDPHEGDPSTPQLSSK